MIVMYTISHSAAKYSRYKEQYFYHAEEGPSARTMQETLNAKFNGELHELSENNVEMNAVYMYEKDTKRLIECLEAFINPQRRKKQPKPVAWGINVKQTKWVQNPGEKLAATTSFRIMRYLYL